MPLAWAHINRNRDKSEYICLTCNRKTDMYMNILNLQIPSDLCALIRAYGKLNQKSTVQVVVAALNSYLAHFARLQQASHEYDIASAHSDVAYPVVPANPLVDSPRSLERRSF